MNLRNEIDQKAKFVKSNCGRSLYGSRGTVFDLGFTDNAVQVEATACKLARAETVFTSRSDRPYSCTR